MIQLRPGVWALDALVPLPEGLFFAHTQATVNGTGKVWYPTILKPDDTSCAEVREVFTGWRRGQWRVTMWRYDGQVVGNQYGETYFYDRERAIAFMKLATPEFMRP